MPFKPVLVKVPNRQNTFPLVFGRKSVVTAGKFLSQTFSQPLAVSLLPFLWNERGILGTRSFTYVIPGPLTALPVFLNRFKRYQDWLKKLIKQLTKTQMCHTTTRPASAKMVDPSTTVRAISFFI